MTHKEAVKLLDMAKDGKDIPEEVMTEALEWTDDIDATQPPCEAVEAWVDRLRCEGVL